MVRTAICRAHFEAGEVGSLRPPAGQADSVTPAGIRIDVRFTHLQLSAMIGTSRETLTKALGELRSSGAIDVRDRLIWVLDADALEAASVIA